MWELFSICWARGASFTCRWKLSSLSAFSSTVALVRKSGGNEPGRFSSSWILWAILAWSLLTNEQTWKKTSQFHAIIKCCFYQNNRDIIDKKWNHKWIKPTSFIHTSLDSLFYKETSDGGLTCSFYPLIISTTPSVLQTLESTERSFHILDGKKLSLWPHHTSALNNQHISVEHCCTSEDHQRTQKYKGFLLLPNNH